MLGQNIGFNRVKLDFKSFLACVACIVVLLYILMGFFGGVNSYFIVPHVISSLAISTLILLAIEVKKEVSPKKLKYLSFILLPIIFVFIAENFNYGSIPLVIVIGLVSGMVAIKMTEPFFENNGEIRVKKVQLYLLLILLVSLTVRITVFATPTVPMGYDTPNYLLLSLKASRMGMDELLNLGLVFSSDAYKDNWNFSMLWLGIIAKLINHLGLDLLLIPKIIIPAVSAFSVIPLFLLARELSDDMTALYSSLFFSLLPSELLFCDLYKEILGEFFVILSLFLLVRFLKRKGIPNLLTFIISAFILWKVAVTAFSKFVMFSIALLPVFVYTGKINSKVIVLTALAIPVIPLIGTSFPVVSFPLSPLRPEINDPYTRFSFPIILLTDLTAFVMAIAGAYIFFASESKLKSIYAAGIAIILSLTIYSGILSGLLGYRIFPSSYFLNTFRFSLYLGIPLSLLSGAFISEMNSKMKNRSYNVLRCFLLMFLIVDLILAAHSATTIHSPSRFYSYISEEDYRQLFGLEYSKYDHVILVGDFTWSPDNKNYAVGNWIRYIVFSKTGELPEVYDTIPDINNSVMLVYNGSEILVRYT